MFQICTKMNSSHKILFVAYDVSLISNWVVKLIPYLKDCEVLVFCIRKLQDKDNCLVDNIDISRFSFREIESCLRDWHPDICVFFNFKGIVEQLLLRICKRRGVKTVYLEHGIISKDVFTFKGLDKDYSIQRFRRVYFQFKQYLSFIYHSTNPIGELYIFFEVLRYNKFNQSPFDWYFVYGERCFNYLKHIYPSADLKKNAKLVGYPLFNIAKDAAEASKLLMEEKEGILYVHQPFILDGITSVSYEEEKDYIMSLQKQYSCKYGKFTILLHPRESLERYKELYKDTDIEVILSPNDFRQFINRKLVIGHYSTALLYALYFNVLTYIVDYPYAAIQPIFKGIFPHFYMDGTPYESNEALSNRQNSQWMLGKYNTYEHIAEEIKRLMVL